MSLTGAERRSLVIAILLAMGAFALAVNYFHFKKAELIGDAEMFPTLVASRSLSSKKLIQSEDVRVELIPKKYRLSNAFTQPESAIGRVAMLSLKKGAQLTDDYVASLNDSRQLSAKIKSDYRAVTVPIDRVGVPSDLIHPGDHVDVAASFDFGSNRANGGQAVTLLQNIEVVASNRQLEVMVENKKDERAPHLAMPLMDTNMNSQTLTLLVTPHDAQKLIFSARYGHLSFMLRKKEDNSILSLKPTGVESITDQLGLTLDRNYREYHGK